MACHLISTKAPSEPMPTYCQLDPKEQITIKLELDTQDFIQENALVNFIRQTETSLFRYQWVKFEIYIWFVITIGAVLTLYVLNFSEGTRNIYLHYMSFLHIDMTQVVEILPQIRQGPNHST